MRSRLIQAAAGLGGGDGLTYVSSPTTLNPGDKASEITLSNGNLTATLTAPGWKGVRAIYGISAGKYAFEFYPKSGGTNLWFIGCCTILASLTATGYNFINSNSGWCHYHIGQKGTNATLTNYGAAWTYGDVITFFIDGDNGKLFVAKNGVMMAGGNPETGDDPMFSGFTGTLYPAVALHTTDGTADINFGGTPFIHTDVIPDGWYAGVGTP